MMIRRRTAYAIIIRGRSSSRRRRTLRDIRRIVIRRR